MATVACINRLQPADGKRDALIGLLREFADFEKHGEWMAPNIPRLVPLLASPPETRWWLAGTIKRDEWNGGNAAEMHLEDAALA